MKFLIPVILLFFSSCGLFHIFPPGANNVINDTRWNEESSIFDIDFSDFYSLALDDNDTLYMGYIESSSSNIKVASYDKANRIWNNIYEPATIAISVKMKFHPDLGLCMGYINPYYGGKFEVKKEDNSWVMYTSSNMGSSAIGIWDYALSTGEKVFAAYSDTTSPTEMYVQDVDFPFADSPWKNIMGSVYTSSLVYKDLSIDVNSFGSIFVGTAVSNSCTIYYSGKYTTQEHKFSDARSFAKIAVDGFNTIYGVHFNTEGVFSVAVFHDSDDNLILERTMILYPDSIFINSLESSSFSVVANKKWGNIYVGFIDYSTRLPVLLKVTAGTVSPMLGLPDTLTNSQSIKLSVDNDGNPVVAVLSDSRKVSVFTKWY